MSDEQTQEHEPEQTEDEKLAELMAQLEQTSTEDEGPPEPDGLQSRDREPVPFDPPRTESPTLGALEVARRPSQETVCENCPNSVWFASTTEVKCYCRVMYITTWSSKEPNILTACDGMFVGQEE